MNKYLTNFRYAVSVRKPILTLRLIKTFLGILLFRKRPLRYVDLAIGYGCNLKCEHCFATALEKKGRRMMTPEEYRNIVQQAMALGAVNFSFQGGEPTLYPALTEYIRKAYPERNVISVTTNGTTLDETKIRELKSLGVDILTISLDSAKAAEHDRFRGVEGAYEKTMSTIHTALANGMRVTLGAVVSHANIRSQGLLELIALAHELEVILFVALASPLGEWAGRDDMLLTAEDREHLAGLVRKYPLLRTDFEGNFIHYGCGAVKEIMYLTPYGDVLPCPFLHLSLGNVFEEKLQDIRTKALENPYFKDYYSLCLAAEDREFIRENLGDFYLPEGQIRSLGKTGPPAEEERIESGRGREI